MSSLTRRDGGAAVSSQLGTGAPPPARRAPDSAKGTATERVVEILEHVVADKVAAEQKMLAVQQRLRELAARLAAAREEERSRLALDIHDDIGQTLTALALCLTQVRRHLREAPDRALSFLDEAERLAQELVGAVRRVAAELRPAMLAELGFGRAMEGLVRGWEQLTGIACRFLSRLGSARPSEAAQITLYRILQEALTNVARHAGARRVSVRLAHTGESLTLEVTDDGRGIPEEKLANAPSVGLTGMQERAADLGGSVEIGPGPHGGTRVIARVPLADPQRRRVRRPRPSPLRRPSRT